jgi:hypothetical protein
MRAPIALARSIMPALALTLVAAPSPGQSGPDVRTGSLAKDGPQPVYSADATDSWNRIFHALFTRTVRVRLSEEFAGDARLEPFRAMGFPDLSISATAVERIEVGDRAIEPLDPLPVHMGSNGSPQRILDEPSFTRLKEALTEALREEARRPPLARALMQSDLWAAHDILFAARPRDEAHRARKDELLERLARMVKKLTLSRSEIAALPDNFADARLPFDLFAADGGWVEVELLPERLHEFSADDRRAARVFLKPCKQRDDRTRDAWLDGFRHRPPRAIVDLDAVALVVQLLLVDTEGTVVPSPLTYDVQVRTFLKADGGRSPETKVAVAELSRRALLVDRKAGGLHGVDERDPAYLPVAGNDYFFASAQVGRPRRDEPILAPLRKRCQSCHGEQIDTIFTFSVKSPDPLPARRLVAADNQHARDVARRKMQRKDFQALRQRWYR